MNSPRNPRRLFYRRLTPLLLLLVATAFAVATVRWALGQLPSSNLTADTSTARAAKRLASGASTGKNADGSGTVEAIKPAWRIWLDAWLASRRGQTDSASSNLAQPTTPPTSRQLVWIDVEALARRHPSWQLADRLAAQMSPPNVARIARTTPVNAPPVGAFAVDGFPGAGENASFWRAFPGREFVAGSTTSRGGTMGSALAPMPISSPFPQRTSTRSLRETTFTDIARAKQERALRELTGYLGRNLSRERTLRALEAREILDEEVAAARALGLLPPEPILLSAEEQLELTNLRLKLLPSSRLSSEEEVVARRRYLYLQSRWDAALRRQEALHLSEIEELREIEPRRLRNEGEAAIEQSQSRLQIADAARLRALSQAQNDLIARDFAEWRPLRNTSQVGATWVNRPVSPSVAFTPSPVSALNTQPSSIAKRKNALSGAAAVDVPGLSLNSTVAPSIRILGTIPQRSVRNSQTITALRAQARRDAQLWAQIITQREGWQRIFTLRSTNKSVLNGTETVWRAWQS